MNSFADSPLFFFMDNISPIIPKISKDVRKIIELSDRGCDARLPVSRVLRNTSCSEKAPRTKPNQVRKSYFDEKAENKFYAERCQSQIDRNVMDPSERYFVPKRDDINQEECWQKYFPHDDSMEEEEFRRKPNAKDFRSKLRATSEKARSNFSSPDDNAYEILTNSIRNDPETARQNIANEMDALRNENIPESYLMRAKTDGYRSKLARSAHPRFTDQTIINGERLIPVDQDYREDFQFKEIQRNSSRNHKYHWQKFNTPTRNHTKNAMDEMSSQFHDFSRCNSRNQRPVSGSARSSDVSRDWEEAAASRIRSRTCSPPVDRRKRSRSFSKTFHENTNQSKNQRDTVILQDIECSSSTIDSQFSKEKSINSSHSMKLPTRFVDRAVDRDSLSDVQKVHATTEQHSCQTILTDASTNRTQMPSYWDFIPLDDNNDQRCKEVSGKRKISYPCQQQISTSSDPSTKRLSNHFTDTLKTKTKIIHRGVKNRQSYSFLADDSANLEYDDISSFVDSQRLSETINSARNCLLHSLREQPGKLLADFDQAKSKPSLERKRTGTSNDRRSSRVIGTMKKQVQSKYESKSQSRISDTLSFGWTHRANRYLKRPGSAKSESNDDKKKKIANFDGGSSDYHKAKTSIVERTAACFKRKLDKSKLKHTSTNSNQRSPVAMQKKIRSEDATCSRLPVRIGNRVRSRNPFASYRTSVKPYDCKEENKGIEMRELSANSRRLSSVRSRTKPKTRPSIILKEAMDYTDTPKNGEPMQIVQPVAEDENRFQEALKGKIDDSSLELVAVKESSSMSKILGNEKLETNADGRGMDEVEVVDAKNDRRRRNMVNRSSTRETSRRTGSTKDVDYGVSKNGATEKCCFHLRNGEYDNCYDRKHKHMPSFRSRKSPIKSQF